jgi:tetratricopeptide (TPR) repeat protein
MKWGLTAGAALLAFIAVVLTIDPKTSTTQRMLLILSTFFALFVAVFLSPFPRVSPSEFEQLEESNATSDPTNVAPDIKTIARGVELSRSDPISAAQGEMALGNLAKAISLFDKSMSNPEKALADAHFYKARALSLLKKNDETLREVNMSLEFQPDFSPALSLKCLALRRLGQLQGALDACDAALQNDRSNYVAWNNKVAVLITMKRYEEGIAAADIGIRLKPDFPQVWNNRAIALHKTSRDPEALDSVNKALSLAPKFSDALLNKGTILKKLGDLDGAGNIYERMVRDNPNDLEATSNLGDYYEQKGRLQDALVAYESALLINPRFEDALYNKGEVLNELTRSGEAIVPLSEATAIDPTDGDALYQLAFAYSRMDQTSNAIGAVERALKIAPTSEQALRLRTELLKKRATQSQGHK